MRATASTDREHEVLALWEATVGRDRWQRDDALLGIAASVPRGLGARNLGLLALRNTIFNRQWSLRSACPACATECEFTVDGVALAEQLGAQPIEQCTTIEWEGRSLTARAPTIDDLIAIAGVADSADAARALLARCLEGAEGLAIDDLALGGPAVGGLERHLEALDPAATIAFQLRCVGCSHEWPSLLDVGEALTAELQRAAERTLIEVDALARAYGWTEAEVLQLSPVRRAAYLQLVEAG
ncbi:hypothetical protein [Reyranella sp.]|uniref:hypothetical protein n=1 Tax=Reyranella sp. TaxID=1929291 RepID=UPI003783ADB4